MKKDLRTHNQRLQRINEIPNEILALTEELRTLLLVDQDLEQTPASDTRNQHLPGIGDTVILTSQSLYGVQAQIIGVTDKRFILKLTTGRIVYRSKQNVRYHDRPSYPQGR